MKKILICIQLSVLFICQPVYSMLQTQCHNSSLTTHLMSTLNVSCDQAEGATGALLNAAANNLSRQEITRLVIAIPDIDRLLAARPDDSEVSHVSSRYNAYGILPGTDKLVSIFQYLGLSPGKMEQFTATISKFLINHQHPDSAYILNKGLTGGQFLKQTANSHFKP